MSIHNLKDALSQNYNISLTRDANAPKEVKPRSWSCQFNIPQAPSCGAEDGAVALLAGIAPSSIIDVKHDDVLTVIPETIIGRYCS